MLITKEWGLQNVTHVRTSLYYPQSNGKLERYYRTIKGDCIRTQVIESLDDAKRLVTDFVDGYNNHRLHSAIGYETPQDRLLGKEQEILKAREEKPAAARVKRKKKRLNRKRDDHLSAMVS